PRLTDSFPPTFAEPDTTGCDVAYGAPPVSTSTARNSCDLVTCPGARATMRTCRYLCRSSFVIVYSGFVAPGMSSPSRHHWYDTVPPGTDAAEPGEAPR